MSLSPLFIIGLVFSLSACFLIVGYTFSPQIGSGWRKYQDGRKKRIADRKEKAQKEMDKLKEELKPPANVASLPLAVAPALPAGVRYADLEELAVSKGIEVEIGRRALESNKRAVVARGRVYLRPRRTQKDIFSFDYKDNLYYINPKLIVTEVMKNGTLKLKLFYDILYSEPLDKFGNLVWDQDFENILTDDAMDQYIVACTFQGQFELTPQVVRLIIITFILVIGLGVAIDAAFHVIPQTNIHWVRAG